MMVVSNILQSHYDRDVRRLCTCIGNGSLTTGEGQLPAELRKYVDNYFPVNYSQKIWCCMKLAFDHHYPLLGMLE
jgi:hypothetical protein